jgi:hypothetical protein
MLSERQLAPRSMMPKPTSIIVDRRSVKTCHIYLPNEPKPISAIAYNGHLYGYVRFYADLDAAQRAADRLVQRGNAAVLTKTVKGLVLWVIEPDARLA